MFPKTEPRLRLAIAGFVLIAAAACGGGNTSPSQVEDGVLRDVAGAPKATPGTPSSANLATGGGGQVAQSGNDAESPEDEAAAERDGTEGAEAADAGNDGGGKKGGKCKGKHKGKRKHCKHKKKNQADAGAKGFETDDEAVDDEPASEEAPQ
jgi:hypothetical protein